MNTDTITLSSDFFAPASTDMVDGLVSQYKYNRKIIEDLSEQVKDKNMQEAIYHFIHGNNIKRNRGIPSVCDIFDLSLAIGSLNSAYWGKAMTLADVYDYMPAERREEWDKQISELTTPDFEEETVRNTIMQLLHNRYQFFCERVDGIFRKLSGDHVTNQPQGFGKRMIIYIEYHKEYITDLRQVVSKLMGMDTQPSWHNTAQLLTVANRNIGQWITIDGGALRMRAYKKGTAHFEVNPEIAWKLNDILANLYPTAIPSEFRKKPIKKLKDFVMIQKPLPYPVLAALGSMDKVRTRPKSEGLTDHPYTLEFGYGTDIQVKEQAGAVLSSIGGVKKSKNAYYWYEFNYDPRDTVDLIVTSGSIPDKKSHQFYPTPEKLAKLAVQFADISDTDMCLEPSAGIGNIAIHMPVERTTCVEISELHCNILRTLGYDCSNSDFMKYTSSNGFDKIVMNPPYSEGRWKAHCEYASTMVNPGGKLIAILPASAKNSFAIPGFCCEYSDTFDNEFVDASVSVVFLIATKIS